MNENQEVFAGGVCIRDGKILLIHRINEERLFNKEYFAFPGLTLQNESIDEGLHRIFTEYGMTIELGELLHSNEDDVLEYYYVCRPIFGELKPFPVDITTADTEKQFSVPIWISLTELDDLIVYPETLKNIVLENLN